MEILALLLKVDFQIMLSESYFYFWIDKFVIFFYKMITF